MSWTLHDVESSMLNLVAALVLFFVMFRAFMIVDAAISWHVPVGPTGMGEAIAILLVITAPLTWIGTRWRSHCEGGLRVHARQCIAVYAAMAVVATMLVAQWGVARGGLEYAILFVFFLHLVTLALTNFVFHLHRESHHI